MTGFFDDEPGGGRLNPADCLEHLLMVWAVGYIEHSPTKYSQVGKNSDVIVVDVVDLDQADSEGYQGLLVRNAWWRNARLIGLMKDRIGRPKPVLARMALGIATMGKPPYELHFATQDENAVARAQAWMEAHPDFKPSAPTTGRLPGHDAERVQASQPAAQQKSQLQLLAEQAVSNAESRRDPHQALLRNLPPPPPRPTPVAEEEPPF
jgi:hypothetical protein